MAIVNIGTLFDRAGVYENRLEEYYTELRDRAADQGVKLLCFYFSRHRHHLQQAVKELEPETARRILNVRLKYDIEFIPEKIIGRVPLEPETVKAEQLLEAAVAWDTALIDLYRRILEQPLNAETKAFIESLVRIEERDIVMIKKMKATNYF